MNSTGLSQGMRSCVDVKGDCLRDHLKVYAPCFFFCTTQPVRSLQVVCSMKLLPPQSGTKGEPSLTHPLGVVLVFTCRPELTPRLNCLPHPTTPQLRAMDHHQPLCCALV